MRFNSIEVMSDDHADGAKKKHCEEVRSHTHAHAAAGRGRLAEGGERDARAQVRTIRIVQMIQQFIQCSLDTSGGGRATPGRRASEPSERQGDGHAAAAVAELLRDVPRHARLVTVLDARSFLDEWESDAEREYCTRPFTQPNATPSESKSSYRASNTSWWNANTRNGAPSG